MSEAKRVLLVGANGLIGRNVIARSREVEGLAVVALARREMAFPPGVRMEMMLAEPSGWEEAVTAIAPDCVVCALGTTWAKAGRDEAAFRAVDHDLVLTVARAAHRAGAGQFITISSVGADANSRNFYLRVKGETEQALHGIGYRRLDILRPGLLRGAREEDRRLMERVGILAAPVTNLFMFGGNRKFRAVSADTVASTVLQCVREKARGRFVHEHDAILHAAGRLERSLILSDYD